MQPHHHAVGCAAAIHHGEPHEAGPFRLEEQRAPGSCSRQRHAVDQHGQPSGAGKPDPIALKVTGGAGPLTVLVNGQLLPAAAGRRTLFFEPEGPGFVRLTVIDGRGATDSVVVRLQ